MAADVWDAVVAGAGIAGLVTAKRLADAGRRVLLVDAKRFPRDKVCGGCLNADAVAGLHAAGLGAALADAETTHTLRLHAGRTVSLPVPAGLAISRHALDRGLLEHCRDAGVECREGVRVVGSRTAGDCRVVTLHGDRRETVPTRLLAAAHGLGGRPLVADAAPARVAQGTRLGAGTILAHCPADLPDGVIQMAVGAAGYVGLAPVEHGRLDVACALDAAAVQAAGSVAAAAAAIVRRSGLAETVSRGEPLLAALAAADWKGTPALTRTTGVLADDRYLAVGDAAGYVEPFTGEGMAWAVRGATALSRLADGILTCGWRPGDADRWRRLHRREVRRRQWRCRLLASLLRRPRLLTLAVAGIDRSRTVRRLAAVLTPPALAHPAATGRSMPTRRRT